MIDNGVRSNNSLTSDQIKLRNFIVMVGLKLVLSKMIIVLMLFHLFFVKSNYLIWIDLYDNTKMINLFNYVSLISSLSKKNKINNNFGRGDYSYKISNFLPEKKNLSSFYIFKSKKYKFIFIAEKLLSFFLKFIIF